MTEDRLRYWETWNSASGPNYPHEKVVQFVLRSFTAQQRQGLPALDLGCGSGVHSLFLAREGFAVTAVDFAETAVQNTLRRLAAGSLTARVRRQAVEEVDTEPAYFALVICIGVFDCAGPAAARAASVRSLRALRPGGRGLFLFAAADDYRVAEGLVPGMHGYERAEVDAMFAGLAERLLIDRYITTYENEKYRQSDWLVTAEA